MSGDLVSLQKRAKTRINTRTHAKSRKTPAKHAKNLALSPKIAQKYAQNTRKIRANTHKTHTQKRAEGSAGGSRISALGISRSPNHGIAKFRDLEISRPRISKDLGGSHATEVEVLPSPPAPLPLAGDGLSTAAAAAAATAVAAAAVAA